MMMNTWTVAVVGIAMAVLGGAEIKADTWTYHSTPSPYIQNAAGWRFEVEDLGDNKLSVTRCVSAPKEGVLDFSESIGEYVITRIGNGSVDLFGSQFYTFRYAVTGLIFPDTLTDIGGITFWACENLTGTLTIPDSVRDIGDYAFAYCRNISSLSLGNSVTNIDGRAFMNCTNLTGMLIIPDSVKNIGNNAFYSCSNISGLALGNSVTNIGHSAFWGCTSLAGTLTIPDSVRSVGVYAFFNCGKLAALSLGNSVETIGYCAFMNCTNLTGVLTIPESVWRIGESTFHNTGFTEISTPSTGVDFRFFAFAENPQLQAVIYRGDCPASVDMDIYGGSFNVTTYVYRGSMGWDGDQRSTALPELWCERPIAFISGDGSTENEVPHWWLDKMYPRDGSDYETLSGMDGKNGIPVWQSWVAGLNPNLATDKFMAFIAMGNNDEPIITWNPNHENAPDPRMRRVYTVLGKTNLADRAETWGKTNELSQFFKVRAEMPPPP